jgi:maltoporin
MERRKLLPRYGQLCLPVAAALFLTGSFCLAQDNNPQAQNSSPNQSNDVSALKSQMQKMQKEYEDRITAMEAEMKTLESKSDSGSILNTRVLTDADGKGVEGSAPVLDESFLKSLTRNFTFSAYVRAGFQFNGNGGGGNFSFSLPSFPGAGRQRLGNENDTYMELTWMQAHMLGDTPDVMDVSMTFTPAIRYVQSRNTFTPSRGNGPANSGNDFDFVMRQAFLEAKNVFKAAPEVTFWAGQRFYDRFNVDPEDYYFLDTSGYGAGVYNIDVGIGKLAIAWLGGLNDNFVSPSVGTLFKHTFDVRLKDIDVGFGKLALVLIGNFQKGATFTQTFDLNGNLTNLANPVHTNSAWGIGGGAIYNVKFGPGGSNNSFTAYALFGRGATDLSASDSFTEGTIQRAENTFLVRNPGSTAGRTINIGDAINHSFIYRAGFQFYIALPWYHSEPAQVVGASKDGKGVAATAAPAPNALPWFSVGLFADWQEIYSGSAIGGTTGPGIGAGGVVVSPNTPVVSKIVSGHVHDIQFGARPAFWLSDNIAIQGQFSGSWESNNINGSGFPGFGKSGWLGVFDVGPVIKPKGGYYTKPELRFFATYAVWSDSLKGMVTPAQENGTDWMAPYNGNTNHGWLFGTQVEWFF